MRSTSGWGCPMADRDIAPPPYEFMSLVDVFARAICDADEAGHDTAGVDAVSHLCADALLAVPADERARMIEEATVAG